MNGPEHYAEAERIVDSASLAPNSRDQHVLLAAAQVHATLALAAATLETTTSPTTGGWSEAVLNR